MTTISGAPDPRLVEFLHASGLCKRDAGATWTALTGGVSSDIWRVDTPERTLCVKCALPKLKVARDWHAPTSRNGYEWAWMQFAAAQIPGCTPQPLAHDSKLGAFAMEFIDTASHPVWKNQLLAGHIHIESARSVASVLGRLHSASTRLPRLPAQFDCDDIFYPIRLEPYLVATGDVHLDLKSILNQMAADTLATHIALVHGDVSPKNLLIGPQAPVYLDAECAWFGDPAFDLAFCLNHFLLKCTPQREHTELLIECFNAFKETYLAQVDWEAPTQIEARAARLLPALFLARVDGKSPVEYITDEADKQLVRDVARPLIQSAPDELAVIANAWRSAQPCSRRV